MYLKLSVEQQLQFITDNLYMHSDMYIKDVFLIHYKEAMWKETKISWDYSDIKGIRAKLIYAFEANPNLPVKEEVERFRLCLEASGVSMLEIQQYHLVQGAFKHFHRGDNADTFRGSIDEMDLIILLLLLTGTTLDPTSSAIENGVYDAITKDGGPRIIGGISYKIFKNGRTDISGLSKLQQTRFDRFLELKEILNTI